MNSTQNARILSQELKRLAELRMQWMAWTAVTDTSNWESTFFFKIFDYQNQEIAALRRALRQKKKDL